MGVGLYFGFLRPALLPEDLRYIGASMAQIQTAAPGLSPWLARVFGVLGGYMIATGLLTVYVAATGFRVGTLGAKVTVARRGAGVHRLDGDRELPYRFRFQMAAPCTCASLGCRAGALWGDRRFHSSGGE